MRGLHGHDPEALRPAGLAERRPLVGAGEETQHGLVIVAERLLLDSLAAITQPFTFTACLRELTALLHESGR
jgi:hypothetical protein